MAFLFGAAVYMPQNRDGILSRVMHSMSVFLERPLFSRYAKLIKPTMPIFA